MSKGVRRRESSVDEMSMKEGQPFSEKCWEREEGTNRV